MTSPSKRTHQNMAYGKSLVVTCEIILPLHNCGKAPDKVIEKKKDFLRRLIRSVDRKVKQECGDVRWYQGAT